MRMITHSFVIFFFLLPLLSEAGSKAVVPTSIQVVDEEGRTVISTTSPSTVPETPRTLFSVPPTCAPFMKDAGGPTVTTVVPSLLEETHPLRTRVESQEASLRALVARLSFAPHLSNTEEDLFKKNLVAEWRQSTSTAILDCLSLITKEFRMHGGGDMNTTVDEIARIIRGLEYAQRHAQTVVIEPPQDAYEALFAGDLLLSTCPSCLSLSMRSDSAEMSFLLPAKLFGQWKQSAKVSLRVERDVVRVDSPWWLALSSHRLSGLTEDIQDIPHSDAGMQGIFIRTQDIIGLISQ